MADWFVRRGENVIGPIEVAKLKEFAANGKLLPTDQLAKDSGGPWTVAGRTQLFAGQSVKPPPTPTPPPPPPIPSTIDPILHTETLGKEIWGRTAPAHQRSIATLIFVGLISATVIGGGYWWYSSHSGVGNQSPATIHKVDNPQVNLDPVASFKSLVPTGSLVGYEELSDDYSHRYVFDNFSIDVKKTDSLISPYMGILEGQYHVVKRSKNTNWQWREDPGGAGQLRLNPA